MTQVMKASDVRQQWSQLLNKVFRGETQIVVEKSGIPVAAVISAEDLERFKLLEQQRQDRFKALDKMREAFQDVSPEELGKQVNKASAEVRLEKQLKSNQD